MDHFYISLILSIVSFVALSLFFILYKHLSYLRGTNLPPGRFGLPFVGETLEFLSEGWKGYPEKFFFHRISRYSSELFKTSLFAVPIAVFCGMAGNKFLFSNENKLVTAWWPDSVNKVFLSSPQTSAPDEAKKTRKLLLNFLKLEALQRYVGIMDHIAQRHFSMDWENKDEVVVFPLSKKFTLCLACRLFASIEDPNHVDKFADPFNKISFGIFTVPIDLPGTPLNKAKNAANFIRKELMGIIKQRKIDLAEGTASPTQDILSQMLLTTNEDGRHMNELDIADKILALLIGGHTANSACTFIVKYLADLPHIYQGVYEEQMAITRSKAPGELLNWDDLQNMNYSWSVACEVLRLASPVQGTFREALTDFMFNGFSIPKGWKLYWSAHLTHKNPEYFPDPEKFDPSRFDGKGPAPYTFVPFGGGPRMCPGKEYARLEILVFMHNLVKRFRWEKVLPDEKITVYPMPTPVKGLPVRLYPHKA